MPAFTVSAMAGGTVAFVERLTARGVAGNPVAHVGPGRFLSRPAAEMGNDGLDFGIGELGEGRHDAPGTSKAHSFAQVGVVDTGKKGGQGQWHADTAAAVGAMTGGTALRIQARAVRFGMRFSGYGCVCAGG